MTGEKPGLTGKLVLWKCPNPNCPVFGGAVQRHDLIYCHKDMPAPEHCKGWPMYFIGGKHPVYHSSRNSAIRDHEGLEEAQEKLRRDVKAFEKGKKP